MKTCRLKFKTDFFVSWNSQCNLLLFQSTMSKEQTEFMRSGGY